MTYPGRQHDFFWQLWPFPGRCGFSYQTWLFLADVAFPTRLNFSCQMWLFLADLTFPVGDDSVRSWLTWLFFFFFFLLLLSDVTSPSILDFPWQTWLFPKDLTFPGRRDIYLADLTFPVTRNLSWQTWRELDFLSWQNRPWDGGWDGVGWISCEERHTGHDSCLLHPQRPRALDRSWNIRPWKVSSCCWWLIWTNAILRSRALTALLSHVILNESL